MSVSYQFSQQHNFQTVLWAIGGAIWIGCNAIGQAYRLLCSAMPALLFALAILAKALLIGAALAGVIAVVASIPPTFWLGLLIVGAYAWATYPRKAVQPCE